ncbi:adenylate/guanylate cyclase domain-containing protein [Patescibacteria group bacterium]|nr:MAG: adenylate/guanylate cyclase domain-containing protein [Patescibacteria group bacterium]
MSSTSATTCSSWATRSSTAGPTRANARPRSRNTASVRSRTRGSAACSSCSSPTSAPSARVPTRPRSASRPSPRPRPRRSPRPPSRPPSRNPRRPRTRTRSRPPDRPAIRTSVNRRARQKLAFWGAASVALSSCLFAVASLGWFEGLHLSLSNSLYRSARPSAREDIVIVAIDDRSLARRSASEDGTLRFSKSDYAKAIDTLARAGAAAIGVDVILSEPAPEADVAALARTLASHPQAVLATRPAYGGTPALSPLPELARAAQGRLGSVLFSADRDSLLRRQGVGTAGEIPAFAVAVVNAFLGQGSEANRREEGTLTVSDEAVRVGSKRVDALRVPLDGSGRFLIRYFGAPGSYRRVSFADVLDGNLVDRDGNSVDLSGAVALIGETGTAVHDEQPTPVSEGVPMSGVEIHANAVQTILSNRSLTEQSPLSAIAFASLALSGALAAFLALSLPLSTLAFAFALAAYAVATWAAFEYGLVLHTAYPPLALALAFAAAYAFRYLTEARLGRETASAFSRYVSPHVVEELMEHPERLQLGGEKREMTVLFSDIAGFTTIAESLDAVDLVAQLNEYLDAVSSVVLAHDGTIDKFIGDAVMAFWNAPLPQADHAIRACRAALAYKARLGELNAKRAQRGLPPFHARIGLNLGPMVVGNVGSSRRFDYTVIGDAVNLASRLESINKAYGTDLIVSEAVLSETAGAFEARELDLIAVKGKDKPVRIFELLCERGKVPEEVRKAVVFFGEGLSAYRSARWDDAQRFFTEALRVRPGDGPSTAFLSRVTDLRAQGVKDGWDGVYRAKEK